jgi:tellurite resistance protein
MNIAEHITFDQLPPACKCLLSIATTAACLRARNSRRQSDEALASIVREFWNSSALAPADLQNFNDITELLCMYYKTTRTAHN